MKQRDRYDTYWLVIVVVACLLSITMIANNARAGDKEPPLPVIEQDQHQRQDQQQDQSQGQDQTQTQTASADNAGNTQVINFQSPDDVTVRNTASANPPSVFGSHTCALGGSLGIGVPGANIGGGKQKVDPECEKRETARLLNAFGERELAVMMLCDTEAAKASLGEACAHSETEEELRRRIDFLLDERAHDRQRAKDELERCKEGTRRADKACRK